MKIHVRLLGLGLLLFWQPRFLSAQETPVAPAKCHDILFLTDGSQLRGQITATLDNGAILSFQTWSGLTMEFPRTQVKRIVQRCADSKSPKEYDFREKGWYHHTRGGFLVGQTYFGENVTGIQLLHSSGWMFSRHFGGGIGIGVDHFGFDGSDVATYPIFVEVRSYLAARRIAPYLSIGGGWAFSGTRTNDDFGRLETWSGGWMAQGDVGYRIGNNFTINLGVRLQQKQREWSSNWWTFESGTDRILHTRFVVGAGLLL